MLILNSFIWTLKNVTKNVLAKILENICKNEENCTSFFISKNENMKKTKI
jgi:hypothetical protein